MDNILQQVPPGAASPADTPLSPQYHRNTYEVVSVMAYLIGVDRIRFEYTPPTLNPDTFNVLSESKDARIIRNLCIIRTALIKHNRDIQRTFTYEIKNIGSIPEFIPSECVLLLNQDGVELYKSKPDVYIYLTIVNSEIANRINNIKPLFPEWLKWDYIRPLFIMPNGSKTQGLKQVINEYNTDRNRYPFQCYINWRGEWQGNILNSDKKFVKLLYEYYHEYFEDDSLVQDAGDKIIDSLDTFLESANRAIIVVDCENSDPIKLTAALYSLTIEQRSAICKLILFDSSYTTAAWKVLSNPSFGLGGITIEYITVDRLKQQKSQVDMALATRTVREVYTNSVDSVILVSSDSDYWAMIQTLDDIKFLVLVEKEKCGRDIKEALSNSEIRYCYIDDFCTSTSYKIKTQTVLNEIKENIAARVAGINMNQLLADALKATWVKMSDSEKKQFYDRYLQKPRITVDADGKVEITLG